MNPATLLILSTAAIQTTNPIMPSSHSIYINTAAIQTTNPFHVSSHSTHITHCQYSNHQIYSWIQPLYSYYPLPLFKPPTPSCRPATLFILTLPLFKPPTPIMYPVTLLILTTAAIQITNPHHAVQLLCSHYPLPLFKPLNPILHSIYSTHINHCRYSKPRAPIMKSSYITHINHCRYSNHQPPSCSPVTILILPTAAKQTTNTHHALQSI
jgi:hypothetical protein